MAHSSPVRILDAPLAVVRSILLDPAGFPTWNPSFLQVEYPGLAKVGQRGAVWTAFGLHGYLTYSFIAETTVMFRWAVPRLEENDTWALADAGDGRTEVRHWMTRRGELADFTRPSVRSLPAWRLDRLERRLAATKRVLAS